MLPDERKFGRREGLYAARDIAIGERLKEEDIAIRRPALGLRSRNLTNTSGAIAKTKIAKDQAIEWSNITYTI
jgi:sialic acid synthase SpsE